MGRFLSRLTLAALALVLVNCTRATDKETVRLVIPFNSGSNSSLAAGDLLKMAIVNIQVPGRAAPIVQEYDFETAPVSWGTSLSLTVNNVPTGNGFVIQFLGVFETTQGASMLITYGDAVANVAAGTTNVSILATAAGSASKEGRVSGRYFTDSTSGPTGPLVAFFYPPNGKPRMAVSKTNMSAGYFNVFALDTIPLTYVHMPSGLTIFGGLTLGSPQIAPSGTHVAKYSIPTYYRRENRNGTISVRKQVASDYTLGFFASGSASITLSPFKVCSAGSTYEGIPGLYLDYNIGGNGKLQNQIKFNSINPTSNDLQKVIGGFEGASYETWATHTDCDPALPGELMFYHQRITQGGEEGVAGMKPPFRVVSPFAIYGGFLRQYYDEMTSTIPQMQLNWAYLPGAAPGDAGSGIDGVDILMHFSNNPGGGGGGREPVCQDYINQQYQVIGSITDPTNFYSHEDASMNASNYYGYSYVVCPYAFDATTNTKSYVGGVIRSDCTGNCGELEHYGWGTSAITISSSTTPETLGQSHARIIDVQPFTSEYTTTVGVTMTSAAPFSTSDAGSEVLLTVVALGSLGDCGMDLAGNMIRPGQMALTKILGASSTSIVIPFGTFLDDIDTTSLTNPANSAAFCYIQATKVLHFSDMTLAGDINVNSFAFNDTGGGFFPMRISGEISVSGNVTISAAGSGYPGGLSGGYSGGGIFGSLSYGFSISNSNGGSENAFVGGGGAGPVSDGGDGGLTGGLTLAQGGMAPISGNSGGSMLNLMMGGGGADMGGSGGGAIFLASRYIQIPSGSSLYISANGKNKMSSYAGGGGAGSVAIMAQRASGALTITAKGGDSGPSFTSTPEGGAGGGGLVSRYICDITNLSFTSNVAAGTGPIASNAMGAAQVGWVYLPATVNENPACR